MRIISDFRDYYGGLVTYDKKDPLINIWVRKQQMVDDQMPEGSQTDVEKIEAHGFDKVVSFRHRK